MATNIDQNMYHSEELQRPTTAPSYTSTTVIKYMATRTICPNLANSPQGSLRNSLPSPLTTSHGLASLVQSPTLSRISSLDSIDGELTIHEQRDLSRLTDTLAETILHCCDLDVHNRAQELQLEWLEQNENKNAVTIEKMFRTEIQTGRQVIEDTLRYKSDLERQLNDIHQATLANDELYQQLLAKRNALHKELFEYQRQLAQNRVESEFLRSRIQMFNDEIQFYDLKNNSLQARKVKLECEYNEEIFAKQVLQMECEVLENEKITNEDIRLASIDDLRRSIDLNQIVSIQPSTYYHEQLNHQIRRMRVEYNRKIQIYRDELHRKFELESHRYKMYQQRSIPTVTKEHELKLEEYKREKNEVEQQISAVRGSFHQLQNRLEEMEKRIDQAQMTTESISNSQRRLTMLQQVIREREEQLEAVIGIRTKLKQQIDHYQEEVNRYSKRVEQPRKSILRKTVSQELHRPASPSPRSIRIVSNPTREMPMEEGTLVRFTDFDAQRDCEELNQLFHELSVDAIAVINILCNRSVAQRLQIRDTFKNLFGQKLGNVIDSKMTGNSKKILKTLLLSPIERDCFEFRRVLKGQNIDETILVELFLSRSNKQIKAAVSNYSKLFKTTLEQDISDTPDNSSKQIFLALLQVDRSKDQDVTDEEILNDAKNLYETNSRWRSDASTFIQLLCNRSNEKLKQILDAYQQFSGVDIEQTIKIDTNVDLSRTLMAIVRIVRNRPRFFAYELRKSLKGSSTNEDTLNRIIISRCEIDMIQIKAEYDKISKRTLHDQIQRNTTGDHQRAILELLRYRIEPIPNENVLEKFLPPPESSVKSRRVEANLNNSDMQHLNQFDRNNQAKSTTLLTLHPGLSRSQYIERQPNGDYEK